MLSWKGYMQKTQKMLRESSARVLEPMLFFLPKKARRVMRKNLVEVKWIGTLCRKLVLPPRQPFRSEALCVANMVLDLEEWAQVRGATLHDVAISNGNLLPDFRW